MTGKKKQSDTKVNLDSSRLRLGDSSEMGIKNEEIQGIVTLVATCPAGTPGSKPLNLALLGPNFIIVNITIHP